MRGRLLESLSKGGTSDLQRIEQTFSLPAVVWRKLHPSTQKGKRLQAQSKLPVDLKKIMYSCGRFITIWIGGRSYLQKFDRLRLETFSMLQHC